MRISTFWEPCRAKGMRMKQDMTLLPAPTDVVTDAVAVMRCPPVARINIGPIANLYEDLGADAAEDTICRVLEDIAGRLNALHALRNRCEFDKIAAPANRIRSIALQIGLDEVGVAAEAVADTSSQGDAVALEATLSRLERGFDAALGQIWDVQTGA